MDSGLLWGPVLAFESQEAGTPATGGGQGIAAVSRCAAAPDHTAQPFQPTPTGLPFLSEAWSKDVVGHTQNAFKNLADRFARKAGSAVISDANRAATQLRESDLVFVDPPHAAVQYSRFYHVLETIASGYCGEVSGSGRYLPSELRPLRATASFPGPAVQLLRGATSPTEFAVHLRGAAGRSTVGR